MSGVRGGSRDGPGIIAATQVGEEWFQRVLVAPDSGASFTVDASATAVPVTDNGGSLTVDGTVAATQSGTWTNLVRAADSASVDAFGRWRVSSPATIFDSKLLLDAAPLFWDDAQTSGSGTGSSHSTATASCTLSVTASTAGTRVRQTKRRISYQPGKSQLVLLTFTMGAAATGITRRAGYFDGDNGIFFEQTSTGVRWVVRSKRTGNVVDTPAEQADWNLDTLNGLGTSGTTLNLTYSQIAVIDLRWLGVGRVRVGFVIDGIGIVYVHQFLNSNRRVGVYMSNPNLPIRYELTNSGAGGAATFECICSAVSSEGGLDRTGLSLTVDRSSTGLTTLNDADLYPLISIRLKSTALSSTVRVTNVSVFCTSTAVFRWALLLNPTVAGTAESYSAVTNASIEAALTATNATKVTGGTLLASGYSETSNANNIPATGQTDYALGATIAGTSDRVTLAVQRLTGTTELFYATLSIADQS